MYVVGTNALLGMLLGDSVTGLLRAADNNTSELVTDPEGEETSQTIDVNALPPEPLDWLGSMVNGAQGLTTLGTIITGRGVTGFSGGLMVSD